MFSLTGAGTWMVGRCSQCFTSRFPQRFGFLHHSDTVLGCRLPQVTGVMVTGRYFCRRQSDEPSDARDNSNDPHTKQQKNKRQGSADKHQKHKHQNSVDAIQRNKQPSVDHATDNVDDEINISTGNKLAQPSDHSLENMKERLEHYTKKLIKSNLKLREVLDNKKRDISSNLIEQELPKTPVAANTMCSSPNQGGSDEENQNKSPLAKDQVFQELMEMIEQDWKDELKLICWCFSDIIPEENSLSLALAKRLKEQQCEDEDQKESSGSQPQHCLTFCKEIGKLQNTGDVKTALQILEQKLLFKATEKSSAYMHSIMINVLSNSCYVKKAFSLFDAMKTMQLAPLPYTYKALFNGVAACADHKYALSQANRFCKLIKNETLAPSLSTYKAMIRAFGRHAHCQTAVSVLYEAASHLTLDGSIMLVCLISCSDDREKGFRHAIEVWHYMEEMGIPFTLEHYSKLLSAATFCGVGNWNEFCGSLMRQRAPGSLQAKSVQAEDCLQDAPEKEATTADVPNLLHFKQVDVKAVKSLFKQDHRVFRFKLLGGVHGLLDHMGKKGLEPDINIFTKMICFMPFSILAEEQLVDTMKSFGIQPDLVFYTHLMKHRAKCANYFKCKELLADMLLDGIEPDRPLALNFVYALRNTKPYPAENVLEDLKVHCITPDLLLYKKLFSIYSTTNFKNRLALLRSLRENHVNPDMSFVNDLRNSIEIATQKLTKHRRGEIVPYYVKSRDHEEEVLQFCSYFNDWLKDVKIVESVASDMSEFHSMSIGARHRIPIADLPVDLFYKESFTEDPWENLENDKTNLKDAP